MASSFWQFYFGDSDWRQRQDIDREVAIEAADFAMLSQQLSKVRRELHDLQLTVAALMKVLSELGQLDPRAVQLRVEAELEAMRPPAPPPPAAHPAKPAVPEVPVRCDRCGKTVASTHTTITANGTLCDSCAGV